MNIRELLDEAELLNTPNFEEVDELVEHVLSDQEILDSLKNIPNKLYVLGEIAEMYITSGNSQSKFSRLTKKETLRVLEEEYL